MSKAASQRSVGLKARPTPRVEGQWRPVVYGADVVGCVALDAKNAL
jgi:hypothetical protein